MTMHWNTYLVRVHPEVDTMDERMERAHRSEVITDRFIRPQADEIALAMFKIPEIRRESDSFTLWNESIRRFNGYDMFGRTEPFYQRAKGEVQAH